MTHAVNSFHSVPDPTAAGGRSGAAATFGLLESAAGGTLVDSEEIGAGAAAEPGSGPVLAVVGLLLSMALVGFVALLLGRRRTGRLMAHPVGGRRETP